MGAIKTEQAFDMLPYVVDIYEKADINTYVKEARKKNKGKDVDVEAAGLDLILYVVKSLSKVKAEVFEVVAIAQEKDVEVVKKDSLSDTLKALKNIFMDDDLVDFFKEAMR